MTNFNRNISTLSTAPYDVLVIGGGIHGAGVAWDAATRGYRVALVEKGDFGGGASAGCFKIVHGGLRYLQHFDFDRVALSVEEQRLLRISAPHLVRPMPFMVPTYGHGKRSHAFLVAGLLLYEFLSRKRNRGVSPSHALPFFKRLSRREVLHIAPGLNPYGLSGAIIYYDCQMTSCERFTLSVVKAAVAAGAAVANYTEVIGSTHAETAETSNLTSVRVRDSITGEECDIRAKFVVNAAGPWVGAVLSRIDPKTIARPAVYSKGIQIAFPEFIKEVAAAVESSVSDKSAKVSRGGRSFFVHPWRGYSLIGTTEAVYEGDPDSFAITKEEITEFVAAFNEVYRAPELSVEHVAHAFGGLRPVDEALLETASSEGGGDAIAQKEVSIEKHWEAANPIDNLLSVVGVKYTTFRQVAEMVMDSVAAKLSGEDSAPPCATHEAPVSGGEIADFDAFLAQAKSDYQTLLSAEQIERLCWLYGTEITQLATLISERPELGQPISAAVETTAAEVVYAARHEMVCHLADVVHRRTGLGTIGNPGEETLAAVAALVTKEFGWSAEREKIELAAATKLFYASQ